MLASPPQGGCGLAWREPVGVEEALIRGRSTSTTECSTRVASRRVVFVDITKTSTGKIQTFSLREMARGIEDQSPSMGLPGPFSTHILLLK